MLRYPLSGFGIGSSNGFVLLAGGEMDANFADHLVFCVAQTDWMLVHSSGGFNSKNARILTGVVFEF